VFDWLQPQDLPTLIARLGRTSSLIELGVLAACLVAAWVAVRALGGRVHRPGSIWFGERLIDGVLFPVLALVFAVAAGWVLQWAFALAVFKIAVPILASLVIIRVAVRVLRVAFPTSPFVRALERTLSWLVWLALVLWVTGLLPLLLTRLDALKWTIGGTEISLRTLIEGLLSGVAVMVLVLWLSAAIEQRLLSGATESALSVRKIAANGTRVGLLILGVLFALTAAGIPLAALSVFGGAIGVGIGFGLQKLASNYVSGFVILAERALRIGDMVKVDNFEGRITDISTRFTVVRSLAGRESLVPNEMLITQRVESFTLAEPKVMLSTVLMVPYGTSIETLMQRLAGVVADVPRVLTEPAPTAELTQFAPDGLELTIQYWIGDTQLGTGNVRSAVNLALLRKLDELGIEIPVPQRSLPLQRRPAG
jgi:small-conductance mechanosensitive channel